MNEKNHHYITPLIFLLIVCFSISVSGVPTTGTFTPIAPLNQVPVQSNHLIWNGLTEKLLNATNVNVSSISTNFTIADPNGDMMNWYMYHNVSGAWELIDSDTGTSNGTKVTTNVSWFRPTTNYTISFNITDSANWTNATYWFVTDFSVPQFSNEDPNNGSIISVALYNWTINITDYATFNWTINCSNGQNNSGNISTNGTFHLNLTNLLASTTYTVYVNATNGNFTNNEWFIFTYVPPTVTGAPIGGGGRPAEDLPSEPSVAVVTSTLITSGIFIILTCSLTVIILIFYKKKKR